MGIAFLSLNNIQSPHFNYKWHFISAASVLVLWEKQDFFILQGAQTQV